MDEDASEAIQQAWQQTIKARALCPYTTDDAVGQSGYLSPHWYLLRGASYFVNLATPLTIEDIRELRQIGGFINRSFIINMVAILEERGVIPYKSDPDTSLEGASTLNLPSGCAIDSRTANGNMTSQRVRTEKLGTCLKSFCRKLLLAIPISLPRLTECWNR